MFLDWVRGDHTTPERCDQS